MTIAAVTPYTATAPERTQTAAVFNTNAAASLAAQKVLANELVVSIPQMNTDISSLNAALADGIATTYTFSTTTADVDPGVNTMRLNQATQNTATVMRLSDTSGGVDLSTLLDTYDDSTNTVKGLLLMQKTSDLSKWILFSLSAVADEVDYKNITVAVLASSEASPFANADPVVVKFARVGDIGATGATGAAGADGSDSLPVAVAGGTVDAITANFTPDIALTDMQACRVILAGANATTTPTFAPDGLTAHTIVKKGGSALIAGDLPGALAVAILQYDLANTRWELLNPQGTVSSGITNYVSETTAYTLTSTKTLLKITPASYGVRITLPDATALVVGGSYHIVDNSGGYPVLLVDNDDTLLGFIYGNTVSTISLEVNGSAAGTWAASNLDRVGCSAQLLTASLYTLIPVGPTAVALDSDRDFIFGQGLSSYLYGVVYRKSTNAWSAVTTIRAAAVGNSATAVLSSTNAVLLVSALTTAFEAVVCTVDAGTDVITVNTADAETLSANVNGWADGCGLIAVGTSFIASYQAGAAKQIREITIAGTTPTISAATVLAGTQGGLIVAGSATVVIAVSTETTNLYTEPFSIGGLAAGTGTTTVSGTMTLHKLKATGGGRWWVCYKDDPYERVGVISLSGTTTTISIATPFVIYETFGDAIIVDTSKLFVVSANAAVGGANIITDTAGTAGAGTAVAQSYNTARCLYMDGTTAAVQNGSSNINIDLFDCSGASPVRSSKQLTSSAKYMTVFSTSNSVLSRSPDALYGTAFAEYAHPSTNSTTNSQQCRVSGGVASNILSKLPHIGATATRYRGTAASEVWAASSTTFLGMQKWECAP